MGNSVCFDSSLGTSIDRTRHMSVLMANPVAVYLGRDLDEAFVLCQILEKTCKASIEAELLGGAKSIGRVEAFRIHHTNSQRLSEQRVRA